MDFSFAENVPDLMAIAYDFLVQNGIADDTGINESEPRYLEFLSTFDRDMGLNQRNGAIDFSARFEKIRNVILSRKIRDEDQLIFHEALLKFLDGQIADDDQYWESGYDGFGLNRIYRESIRIFPVIPGIINWMVNPEGWDPPFLRDRHRVPMLHSFLKNSIVLHQRDHPRIGIRCIPYRMPGLVQKAKKRGICFGLVPFSSEPIDKYLDITFPDGFFRSEGARREILPDKDGKTCAQFLRDNYFDALSKALLHKPDVIVFPEMILSDEIVEEIPNFIRKTKHREEVLIVAGTHWKDGKNTCHVYNEEGKELVSQTKRARFEYHKDGKTYLEGLVSSRDNPPEITFLDIQDVGRLAFFVCKDLMEEHSLLLIKQMWTDGVLVPMYSPSLDVISPAQSLSSEYHMVVVWVNHCSNGKTNGKPFAGFVYPTTTEGHRDVRTFLVPAPSSTCEACLKTGCGGALAKFLPIIPSDGNRDIQIEKSA